MVRECSIITERKDMDHYAMATFHERMGPERLYDGKPCRDDNKPSLKRRDVN